MITPEALGAWKDLERRLRPYVAGRMASAADVDDVLQEIFVKMHRGLGSLRDEERFGAWAYRIARHTIADAGRQRTRDALVLMDDGQVPEPSDTDEPDTLEAELGECIALFVSRLPSPYREAITLTELEGLTQQEAADMVGATLPAMKSRVQRGRAKIRDLFEACCRISVDGRGHIVACEPRDLADMPEDCRPAAESWIARHRR